LLDSESFYCSTCPVRRKILNWGERNYYILRIPFQSNLVKDFLSIILYITVLYRIRLFFVAPSEGVLANPFEVSTFYYSISFLSDLFYIFIAVSIVYFMEETIRRSVFRRWSSIGVGVFSVFLIIFTALVYGSHLKMLEVFNTGFQLEYLMDALIIFPLKHLVEQITLTDYFLFTIPAFILFAFQHVPKKVISARDRINRRLTISLAFLSVLVVLVTSDKVKNINKVKNPVNYFVEDVARVFTTDYESQHSQEHAPTGVNTAKWLEKSQYNSLQLIDPMFVHDVKPQKVLAVSQNKKWNVVFIILESTGIDYVFDRSLNNEIPMPFLKKISEKSLYMSNHYATTNSSPRALFSIFSGLYGQVGRNFLSIKRNNRIPSIKTFLDSGYDSFFVSPFDSGYFFPGPFLYNSSLTEIYGNETLPVTKDTKYVENGRDENEAADFFLARMKKSKGPFLGVYYSYAPHYPYNEYGEKYHVVKNPTKKKHRYYNNLRLLDTVIEKIFAQLKSDGKLDDTIVVLVGDHSEAFAQHPNNYVHTKYTYNENLRVPMMIYQPNLFKARKISMPTSHIDILPTLLDALRIPYNEKLVQGESLFQKEFRRKYVYASGKDNTDINVSKDNIKLMVSYEDDSCKAFDLKLDPGERNNLGCHRFKNQKNALYAMRHYQRRVINAYNRSIHKKEPFHGQQHLFRTERAFVKTRKIPKHLDIKWFPKIDPEEESDEGQPLKPDDLANAVKKRPKTALNGLSEKLSKDKTLIKNK